MHVSIPNFSENARSAERNFLLKSSRALARWVLLTSKPKSPMNERITLPENPIIAKCGTVRLTTAQALVRYLSGLRTRVEGPQGDEIVPLFGGVFAIFGHGNVAGIGEALYQYRDRLPTYRAHNEQAMAHAAIAYSKAQFGRRIMACTTSIGPGATNLITAAALAHVNRLPVLFLPGDIFVSRDPDPVLQQVENFSDGTVSANDCFRPVSRYFDRILQPSQLLTSLPRAVLTLTDPVLCGPATLALPQDVQAAAFDYPAEFFESPVVEFRAAPPTDGHMEYGYSCMGYEIAGGLGVKMARPECEIIVMLGDGSYLMLNNEIATSVMLDKKLIIVLLDNRGSGCINRLQQSCGGNPFNNMLKDCLQFGTGAPDIDFAANAASLGALSEKVANIAELEAALRRARSANRTYLICIDTDDTRTTEEGGWWWEVAVPEESPCETVRQARADYLRGKENQTH